MLIQLEGRHSITYIVIFVKNEKCIHYPFIDNEYGQTVVIRNIRTLYETSNLSQREKFID